MLGRFLELALVVDDPGPAWLRYQQYGFAAAETGDVWNHAYGVVACRGFALGLHARGTETMSVVFVRPDVAALHRDLAARGVQVEQARLGSDAFNELALREPGGMLVRVLEARTFSPPLEIPEQTLFGSFLSLSLPCRNVARAAEFWRALGFDVVDSTDPWEGFAVPGTPLACHARRALPEPALLFRQPLGSDINVIGNSQLQRESPLVSLGETEHALLRTDEDLAVLVLS
jgi:hypothetical protein